MKLVFRHPGSSLRILIDPGKIEQVLNNLISNAIKFCPPDTTITVEVLRQRHEALLAVRDEGPGIPAHELERVFQPFQRTSVPSTHVDQSTGLGLAIVKKIVEGHGGRAWVESESGRGSTFYVSLPLETDPAGVR